MSKTTVARSASPIRVAGLITFLAGFTACGKQPSPNPSPNPGTSVVVNPTTANMAPSATTSRVASKPVALPACAVAYVKGVEGLTTGADLSAKGVTKLSAGTSVTIGVRDTGHEVTVLGPALFRACTEDEPELILVAMGEVSLEAATSIRPGTELFIATPSAVAIVSKAGLRLLAAMDQTAWEMQSGSAVITTLDLTKNVGEKEKGVFKRRDNGEVLLTRCNVQAAAEAGAGRILADLAKPNSSVPSGVSSVGELTAARVKHGRERTLDCGFAEVFAMSCDAEPKTPGCFRGGYAGVRSMMAKAREPR